MVWPASGGPPQREPPLQEHEWLLSDLARHLDMPSATLYSWIGKGWLKSRKETGGQGRIVAWADTTEIARLRERRTRPAGEATRRIWA